MVKKRRNENILIQVVTQNDKRENVKGDLRHRWDLNRPTTSCLLDRRSNQLSYGAVCEAAAKYLRTSSVITRVIY